MKLRKVILKIHLYGGLLCFWYLIIFAVSSLNFQHHFSFMEEDGRVIETRELSLIFSESRDKDVRAKSIQNVTGIAGWTVPWETLTDTSGNFFTRINNPVYDYKLAFNKKTGITEIQKIKKGSWQALNILHGFGGKMPNAPLMIFWAIYTYICMAVVLFSIVSGIYLWASTGSEKKAGWISIIGISAFSFGVMYYIYVSG